MHFLTQSLPFKGVNKDYYFIMTNANKHDDFIYFHLPSGDFVRSGSHYVKAHLQVTILVNLKISFAIKMYLLLICFYSNQETHNS